MKKFIYLALMLLCISNKVVVAQTLQQGEIIVDGLTVATLAEAQDKLIDGSIIYLGPGVFNTGIHIKKNNVVLSGVKGTHFIDAVIEGKAAIITSGDNITIENIECSKMQNTAGNGACIRHQGENLTVLGVYFHDSEQGILEATNKGNMTIKFSRFERLGYRGRAHGIYTSGKKLEVIDSQFINMVSQGHSVKSKSYITIIKNCTFTNASGDDSRLIDIPYGGVLTISNSILHQSNTTVNRQVIGYGLEKMGRVRPHSINIVGNLIVMERLKGNELIALPKWREKYIKYDVKIESNVLIGKHIDQDKWKDTNYLFETRTEAKLLADQLPPIANLSSLINFLSSL